MLILSYNAGLQWHRWHGWEHWACRCAFPMRTEVCLPVLTATPWVQRVSHATERWVPMPQGQPGARAWESQGQQGALVRSPSEESQLKF